MDEDSFRHAKLACYSLAHSLGTNGLKQTKLVECLQGIEKHAINDELCIRSMLGVFYDGLAYGNWPWIRNGIDTLKDVEPTKL